MKFKLDKYNQDKLKRLFDINDRNIDVSEFYNAYLHNESKVFSYTTLDKIKNGSKLNEEQCFYYAILGLLDADYDDPYIQEMANFNQINVVKELSIEDYKNNPYFRNIKCFESTNGNIKLHYRNYSKYEGFIYDDVDFDKDLNELTHLGYFKENIEYLVLSKKDTIWMSITPHEINTMQKSIKECKGNCVVMGLGLGYYPYMISMKDDVTKVTIIEKDKAIIDLFKTHLLPQFPYRDKIQIIEFDALKYAKDMECDYCFVDLWHDEIDGLPIYKKFLNLEKNNIKYSYWIENSFVAILRRCLITLINEQFYSFTNCKYDKEENYFDHLINEFYKLTTNIEFTSFEQIKDFLTKENIKKLLKKTR